MNLLTEMTSLVISKWEICCKDKSLPIHTGYALSHSCLNGYHSNHMCVCACLLACMFIRLCLYWVGGVTGAVPSSPPPRLMRPNFRSRRLFVTCRLSSAHRLVCQSHKGTSFFDRCVYEDVLFCNTPSPSACVCVKQRMNGNKGGNLPVTHEGTCQLPVR